MEKFIVGLYNDEEILLKAVKKVRASGIKIHDVRTPFPVHGLDAAMGMKDSRLHTVGFIAGACGATFALSFISWVTVVDYPTNFGGKPFFSLPSYIPITFEFTVLSAAITMTVAFFIRCGLSVVKAPRIFDERTTDDMFAVIFEVDEHTSNDDLDKINNVLSETGAAEIKQKEFGGK
ncbi:MAG: DUF3341 domain-containing protein [Chitinophagales bacterium]|nr:DUF3341 domain-containing protein [Chitinophagales bacterium]